MTYVVRSPFLHTLQERGFIYQCTDLEALDKRMIDSPIAAYIGFDCTAESLHVGHLLSIMALRHLQRAGHKPIVLLGGGTTLIGDPSGKSEQRQMLTPEVIATYADSIKNCFAPFIDFSQGALCLNNADWLKTFNYIDFLRTYGIHFSINRMLSFDSVKSRLGADSSLSFLEFNYMLLQAIDFSELNNRHGVVLQMGGADQWGNIINGVDLSRRLGQPTVYGLTFPLLTTASGAKMGKSVGGAVWLKESLLSPWDYWQYFRNSEDADVGRFLRLFTELPIDDIVRLEALSGKDINEAKKILATEATALCHGIDKAHAALKQGESIFEQGSASNIPSFTLSPNLLPMSLVDLLVHQLALFPSKSAARRMIESHGVKINGTPCLDYAFLISSQEMGSFTLSVGKNTYYTIVID